MREGDRLAHESDQLAERFEAHRVHLRGVAYRMLGSLSEADDAVQETWLNLSRTDISAVRNLPGWLTTAVARVCLDMLRSRRSRREELVGARVPEQLGDGGGVVDPEHEALQADSVGLALLVVLDTLSPAERLAFVLHDMFAVPFDEIAPIAGCSPAAARQLASRARRRVPARTDDRDADPAQQREVVDAFLAASRDGEFEALLALLDPHVVVRSDEAVVQVGGPRLLRGAAAAASTFSGRAKDAEPALVNGMAGLVWAPGGRPRVAFEFMLLAGRIVEIRLADATRVGSLALTSR
jgi:RNA polymerase sigma-70 factor (ECF subfamily)